MATRHDRIPTAPRPGRGPATNSALHSRARDPFAPLLSVEAIRGQAVVALPAVDTIASPVAGQDRGLEFQRRHIRATVRYLARRRWAASSGSFSGPTPRGNARRRALLTPNLA